MMKITINGESREVPQGQTLPELLAALGLEGKPVVIERNHAALSPSEHGQCVLQEGDSLELVVIAAGG